MQFNEEVLRLQQFVMDRGLPKADMALFGIRCPYCGKSDRIRRLEEPEQLVGKIDSKDMGIYAELWMKLEKPGESLGVCKFCHNPLRIYGAEGKAKALIEEEAK